MAHNLSLRYRQLRRLTRAFPLSFSGGLYQACRPGTKVSAPPAISTSSTQRKIGTPFVEIVFCASRFSTVAEISQDPPHEPDLMPFIEAAFDQVKGPYHCWLNRTDGHKDFFKKDGIFLLLVGMPYEDLQKAKFLQQRCPGIQVFAFQSDSSFSSSKNYSSLAHLIMKEYINFPILLSNKTFPEMTKGPCYILFKGFRSPQLYHQKDMDFGILERAIKSLHDQGDETRSNADKLKSSWSKQSDLINEPYICSSLRNLLLYYPACISGDENGGRFFLSDSNHHRIIICDGNGKILDSIGSSPGFEDGEFDNARLVRPAGSLYLASEDSLYFVDSENHAIRKADMERRVVETVFPNSKEGKEKGGMWSWIVTKLGMKSEAKTKSDEFESEMLTYPWHLIKPKEEDNLLIMNKSFDTLWVMDFDTFVINQVIRGSQNILNTYGDIMEEFSAPENLSHNQVQSLVTHFQPLDSNQCDSLLSSFATSGNCLLVCDKVGHRVLKYDTTTDVVSSLELSNFGILGLPYWLSCSIERIYSTNMHMESHPDHFQSFTLLPGKVDIKLNIDIPSTTELVEPLQEGCVWCQARGSAVEISGLESIGAPPEKVGVSQQWYDELDNLAFNPDEEVSQEEEEADLQADLSDDRIHIDCCVNTSPGSSEVIIFAALYLRLKKGSSSWEGNQQKKAGAIADILKPERSGQMNRDAFLELLLRSNRDLEDVVFTKTLHVRIQLSTPEHPKADNTKDIVLTDSRVEVDVSL